MKLCLAVVRVERKQRLDTVDTIVTVDGCEQAGKKQCLDTVDTVETLARCGLNRKETETGDTVEKVS